MCGRAGEQNLLIFGVVREAVFARRFESSIAASAAVVSSRSRRRCCRVETDGEYTLPVSCILPGELSAQDPGFVVRLPSSRHGRERTVARRTLEAGLNEGEPGDAVVHARREARHVRCGIAAALQHEVGQPEIEVRNGLLLSFWIPHAEKLGGILRQGRQVLLAGCEDTTSPLSEAMASFPLSRFCHSM